MPASASSSLHTQRVLACIMVAILALLSGMFAIEQLCTFRPRRTHEWVCALLIAALFILVLVYLCCYIMRGGGDVARESFADLPGAYNWGHTADALDPHAPLTAAAAPYSCAHTSRVVGPNPKKDEVYTWQYNPQNTLVDYKFYETDPSDPKATPTRIAPVADGDIGRRDFPMVEKAGQGLCNNNATGTAYGVQSSASAAPVPTATMEWGYGD